MSWWNGALIADPPTAKGFVMSVCSIEDEEEHECEEERRIVLVLRPSEGRAPRAREGMACAGGMDVAEDGPCLVLPDPLRSVPFEWRLLLSCWGRVFYW